MKERFINMIDLKIEKSKTEKEKKELQDIKKVYLMLEAAR